VRLQQLVVNTKKKAKDVIITALNLIFAAYSAASKIDLPFLR
jgi:hypothetical protein